MIRSIDDSDRSRRGSEPTGDTEQVMTDRPVRAPRASDPPPSAPGAPAATTDAVLASLAARGRPRRFRQGAVVIQEGDRDDTVYLVVSGRLRAYVDNADGRELTLSSHGPGDMVGEMALDGGPRSATVVATVPSTCIAVDRAALLAAIGDHPPIALWLIARVIGRARLATETARGLALMGVYGRLARLLESLAVAQPDGSRMTAEPMTQLELAAGVGASREMVSRVLKDLETGGYIRRAGRRYVLVRALPSGW
jgi:CRP/FNR family cyclic AMP-dependent transcriptional regulator